MIDGEGQQHMNWKYCRNVSWHWFILIWSVDVSERTSVPKITHTKTKRTLRARNAKRISYAKMIEMDSEGEEDDSSSDFIMSESDYSTSLGVCITSRPILVLLHLYIFCMCLFESYYAMIFFFYRFQDQTPERMDDMTSDIEPMHEDGLETRLPDFNKICKSTGIFKLIFNRKHTSHKI